MVHPPKPQWTGHPKAVRSTTQSHSVGSPRPDKAAKAILQLAGRNAGTRQRKEAVTSGEGGERGQGGGRDQEDNDVFHRTAASSMSRPFASSSGPTLLPGCLSLHRRPRPFYSWIPSSLSVIVLARWRSADTRPDRHRAPTDISCRHSGPPGDARLRPRCSELAKMTGTIGNWPMFGRCRSGGRLVDP
jgi:hypothetical protein